MTPTDVSDAMGGPETGESIDAGLESSMDEGFGATEAPVQEDEPVEEPPTPVEPEPEQEEVEEKQPADAAKDPLENEGFDKAAGGKRYLVDRTKLNDLIAQRDFAEQIRDIAPTVEAARALQVDAGDFNTMRSDFATGDRDAQQAFARFWASENPTAFPAAVGAMLDQCAVANPQAYERFTNMALSQVLDGIYQEAKQKGDDHLLYAAQRLEHERFGKFRKVDQIKTVDPAEARMREVERREQGLNANIQKQHDAYWQEAARGISTQRETALNSAIDEALAPAKGKHSESVMRALRRDIQAEVEQAVKKDGEWSRNHSLQHRNIENMVRQGLRSNQRIETSESAKAYVDAYLAKAAPIIKRVAREQIGEQTKKVVAENAAKHDQWKASQKPGTAGGAPARKSIAPKTGDTFESDYEAAWAPARSAFR